jgi:hypothetical protein
MKSKLVPKTPFQLFNEMFFNDSSFSRLNGEDKIYIPSTIITWYDKKGIIQLGNCAVDSLGLPTWQHDETLVVRKKVAEILIDAPHVCGEYTCYVVKIVNKDTGEIARNTFHFKTYLKKRFDTRSDYKSDGFKIVEHCGINWYIAIPDDKEVRIMANAILKYIAEYI